MQNGFKSLFFFSPLFIKKKSQIETFVTLVSDSGTISFVVATQLKTLRINTVLLI